MTPGSYRELRQVIRVAEANESRYLALCGRQGDKIWLHPELLDADEGRKLTVLVLVQRRVAIVARTPESAREAAKILFCSVDREVEQKIFPVLVLLDARRSCQPQSGRGHKDRNDITSAAIDLADQMIRQKAARFEGNKTAALKALAGLWGVCSYRKLDEENTAHRTNLHLAIRRALAEVAFFSLDLQTEPLAAGSARVRKSLRAALVNWRGEIHSDADVLHEGDDLLLSEDHIEGLPQTSKVPYADSISSSQPGHSTKIPMGRGAH
jgi:hypothetical protein